MTSTSRGGGQTFCVGGGYGYDEGEEEMDASSLQELNFSSSYFTVMLSWMELNDHEIFWNLSSKTFKCNMHLGSKQKGFNKKIGPELQSFNNGLHFLCHINQV